MSTARSFTLGPPERLQARALVTDDGLYAVVRTMDSYDREWKVLLEQIVAALSPPGSLSDRLERLAAIEPTPFSGYGASLLLGNVARVGHFRVFRFAWWGDCTLYAVRGGAAAPVNRPHTFAAPDRTLWTRSFGDRLGPARDTLLLDGVDRIVLLTDVLTGTPDDARQRALVVPLEDLHAALRSLPEPHTGERSGVALCVDRPA